MAKKKPGRPKGTKNLEYDMVDEYPAACRKCGSTDLSTMRNNRPDIKNISGRAANGTIYNRVRWDCKRCKNCGQAVKVKRTECIAAEKKKEKGKSVFTDPEYVDMGPESVKI